MKRPTPKALRQQCARFNDLHPVGTEVIVRMDSGAVLTTKTRTEAHVLSGHSAVIWLDGISGCYLLDRVRPASVAQEPQP